MSSDGEDSEAAEWEREQMLRGTQSRRPHQQQTRAYQQQSKISASDSQESGSKPPNKQCSSTDSAIDVDYAKKHVQSDIKKAEQAIESIRRSMGSTRIELAQVDKKLESIRLRSAELESLNPLYQELARLKQPDEVLQFLEAHKADWDKAPHDQKEVLDLLAKRMRDSQQPMEVAAIDDELE